MKWSCNTCHSPTNFQLKKGGIICVQCRMILYYPNSLEYKFAFTCGIENASKVFLTRFWNLIK